MFRKKCLDFVFRQPKKCEFLPIFLYTQSKNVIYGSHSDMHKRTFLSHFTHTHTAMMFKGIFQFSPLSHSLTSVIALVRVLHLLHPAIIYENINKFKKQVDDQPLLHRRCQVSEKKHHFVPETSSSSVSVSFHNLST